MSVQETIEAAVLGAVHDSMAVTTERREITESRYVEDFEDEDYGYYDNVGTGEYRDERVERVGQQYDGSNDEFAKLITERLLEEKDIKGRDARKVLSAITEALNEYPTKEINGKVEHYFEGWSLGEFAEQLAEKIEPRLESKGVLGKIAGLLKLKR